MHNAQCTTHAWCYSHAHGAQVEQNSQTCIPTVHAVRAEIYKYAPNVRVDAA
jgi:hypothetical protein